MAGASQRASLLSSRALTAEDSARLGSQDLFGAMRAAASRSPAAHLTVALVTEDVRAGESAAPIRLPCLPACSELSAPSLSRSLLAPP